MQRKRKNREDKNLGYLLCDSVYGKLSFISNYKSIHKFTLIGKQMVCDIKEWSRA